MPAAIIGLGVIVLLWFSLGAALTSANQGHAQTGFWGTLLGAAIGIVQFPIELSLKLAKYIAHWMYPAFASVADTCAQFFAAHGQLWSYQVSHGHRNSVAASNIAEWADTTLREEILAQAKLKAGTEAAKNALTKAPPPPQRRYTQHQVDTEFQRLIDSNFRKQLTQKFPKWDWGKGKWIAFLGLGDLHHGAVVTTPHVPPKPVAPVKAKPQPHRVTPVEPDPSKVPGHETGPGAQPVPVGPPQPDTNPHTGDNPYPDPGTKYVPSVISGKDKWARGQIVTLKARHKSLLDHLGPLAFLVIPATAIATLIGMLECKNFGKFSRAICHIPTNAFSNLLGLLLDIFILADICEVMALVQEGASLIETPLADFIGGVGGALCHGDFPEKVWPGLNYSTAAPELNALAL